MSLSMHFDNNGKPFAISAIVWAVLALFSIASLREQHVRRRYIQRDIIFLLTCNIILRLFWYLRQDYNSNFATRFINRIAILVQLTGLVLLFQTWFKSISDNPSMSRKFKYFCFGAIIVSWVFILATVFQCIEGYCIWYTVNIVFIGLMSFVLALGVLIYGIMVRKRLMDVSNQDLFNSTAYNARLRQAHQLFRVCGAIVVLFTIRAILFGMGEFVNLVGYDLYPWWFYQIPEGVPHVLVLMNLMPSKSPVMRLWRSFTKKLCCLVKKDPKKRSGLEMTTPVENSPSGSSDL